MAAKKSKFMTTKNKIKIGRCKYEQIGETKFYQIRDMLFPSYVGCPIGFTQPLRLSFRIKLGNKKPPSLKKLTDDQKIIKVRGFRFGLVGIKRNSYGKYSTCDLEYMELLR